MRRTALFATVFVLLAGAVAPASGASTNGMTVPLDQSRRVPFAGAAASVIPGNADLIYSYIVSPTDVRVVGRKLGVTNLVVLDSRGQTLFDREIVVSAGDGSVVTVYRGGQATDYACSPNCSTAQGNGGQSSTAQSPAAVNGASVLLGAAAAGYAIGKGVSPADSSSAASAAPPSAQSATH
jgi:hypothetical protein